MDRPRSVERKPYNQVPATLVVTAGWLHLVSPCTLPSASVSLDVSVFICLCPCTGYVCIHTQLQTQIPARGTCTGTQMRYIHRWISGAFHIASIGEALTEIQTAGADAYFHHASLVRFDGRAHLRHCPVARVHAQSVLRPLTPRARPFVGFAASSGTRWHAAQVTGKGRGCQGHGAQTRDARAWYITNHEPPASCVRACLCMCVFV